MVFMLIHYLFDNILSVKLQVAVFKYCMCQLTVFPLNLFHNGSKTEKENEVLTLSTDISLPAVGGLGRAEIAHASVLPGHRQCLTQPHLCGSQIITSPVG